MKNSNAFKTQFGISNQVKWIAHNNNNNFSDFLLRKRDGPVQNSILWYFYRCGYTDWPSLALYVPLLSANIIPNVFFCLNFVFAKKMSSLVQFEWWNFVNLFPFEEVELFLFYSHRFVMINNNKTYTFPHYAWEVTRLNDNKELILWVDCITTLCKKTFQTKMTRKIYFKNSFSKFKQLIHTTKWEIHINSHFSVNFNSGTVFTSLHLSIEVACSTFDRALSLTTTVRELKLEINKNILCNFSSDCRSW